MNQGYVAPSFETPATPSAEEPINNVSQPMANNDINQSSPMNNMNQGYVAPSSTPSAEEPVNNVSQQVVENNVNQSEPNQNSAQGIEPNEAIINAEKPHTSFWSNRNNQ